MKYKAITTNIIIPIISLAVLVTPMLVFAQIQNPLKFNNISAFIADLLGYVVKVGGVIATFVFIWVGFLYVQAQGNPEKLEDARRVFINTVYGVAILLGAQLIGTIIKNTVTSLTTK